MWCLWKLRNKLCFHGGAEMDRKDLEEMEADDALPRDGGKAGPDH